jgi:hypothetical protein
MDVIDCTNLKHWKVVEKKTSGRYIGFTPLGRVCDGEGLGCARGLQLPVFVALVVLT